MEAYLNKDLSARKAAAKERDLRSFPEQMDFEVEILYFETLLLKTLMEEEEIRKFIAFVESKLDDRGIIWLKLGLIESYKSILPLPEIFWPISLRKMTDKSVLKQDFLEFINQMRQENFSGLVKKYGWFSRSFYDHAIGYLAGLFEAYTKQNNQQMQKKISRSRPKNSFL